MKFPAEKFNSKLYLLINDESYQFDNKLFFSVDNVEKSKILQITNKKVISNIFQIVHLSSLILLFKILIIH